MTMEDKYNIYMWHRVEVAGPLSWKREVMVSPSLITSVPDTRQYSNKDVQKFNELRKYQQENKFSEGNDDV